MEKNKIYTKNVFITPEYAEKLLQKNVCNRPLTQKTVAWYAHQMITGQWTISGQTISISDKGTLLDGQHRLAALIKANVCLWFTIAYDVPSDSFINYDSLKSRSSRDAFSIAEIPNYTQIATLISGYNAIITGQIASLGFGFQLEKSRGVGIEKSRLKFTNKEMLELYYSNSELFQEVNRYAVSFSKNKKLFRISQIGAFMYYLINDKMHPKEKVFEFFRQLHTNENVTNKTIFYLREKLIDDAMAQYKMLPRMKYVFLVKTWNAYISGKELKLFRYSEEDNFIQFL